MQIDQVKKLQPVDRLVYWIKQRESIRLKKEAGEPKPWTDDVILQSYRFCNVRRMDDKVSKWLMDNWYVPYKNHKNILLACTLARQFNNPESLNAIGFPVKWNPKRCCEILTKRAKDGLRNFNAAYMITGTLGGTKVEQIIWKVADQLYNNPPEIDTDSMQTTAENLIPYNGFSHFMSGQVVADLRWAMSGKWKDKYTWAPVGPGSKRGLNRLYEREINTPMKYDEFSSLFYETMNSLGERLPDSITDRMEAHDYQNCLCEFDKMERTLFDKRRPKQLYKGVL